MPPTPHKSTRHPLETVDRESLFRRLSRVEKNPVNLEDFIQAGFIRGYEKWTTYNPKYPLENWLYAIICNLIVDYYRNNKTINCIGSMEEIQFDNSKYTLVPDVEENSRRIHNSMEEVEYKKEELDILLEMIEELPEPLKDVMVSLYVKGESRESYQKRMGISTTSIRQLVYRARQTLKAKAEEMNERLQTSIGSN